MASRALKGMIFFLHLGFSLAGHAAVVEVPLNSDDRLVVKGVSAQITYQVQPGPRKLRIGGLEEAGWIIERGEGQLFLLGPEADSRRALAEQMGKIKSKPVIEVTGPSLPVEIHLREGAVQLNRGQHEAVVTLKSGKLLAQGRTGALKAHLMKGEVLISDNAGRLDLEMYQGPMVLKNLTGLDGEVSLFEGLCQIENARGTLSVSTSKGTTKIQKYTGALTIENGRGSWSAQGVQGRIDGSFQEGSATLQLVNDAEVNLRSINSRISLQLPKSSGAHLSLQTTDGEITVPASLKVTRGSAEKSARGRLTGEGGRFSINIRSQEGTISVREM